MPNFKKYIGLKYKKSGLSIEGLDCFGLLHLIYKEMLGVELPKLNHLGYDRNWDGSQITENMYTYWYRVDPPYKMYDGLIFCRYTGSRIADHIGMYLGDNKLLHIEEGKTSEIARLMGTSFEDRLYAVMRLKGDDK